MTPDPTRYTETHDAKVRAVAWSWYDNQSGLQVEDLEDVTQEGRMACWKWLVANPNETLGPGLVRVLTIAACRDWERSTRKHRTCEELPAGATSDPWSSETCENLPTLPPSQEYEVMLGNVLSQIVYDEREALVALYVIYQGLTVREAADEMEVGRSTAQDIINRLRERATDLGVC